MYIDTHCHISKDDYSDIHQVIRDNLESGVGKMIISGCTRDTIKESLELSKQYDSIYVTIGYHPSEVLTTNDEDLLLLEEQLQDSKAVGVGEIGLDYHYGKEDREEQKTLFIKQMKLADKYHLTVVIHSRDATEDTIQILKMFPNVIGDIHCFSGSIETALIYISMGYKLGIGGVVTFKNSNLFKAVEAVGIDNILLETDSPYLTPVPYRGQRNEPAHILDIAMFLSNLYNKDSSSKNILVNVGPILFKNISKYSPYLCWKFCSYIWLFRIQ